MKNLVILPTYNESKNIIKTIDLVLAQRDDLNILIIDDNSPDGTAKIVKNLNNEKIFIIERESKKGLGSAYVEGFSWSLKNNYQKIIQMDADLSHDPKEINPMLNLLESNDLVIGSRYEGGLRVINWPIRRLYISYFANIYARLITGVPVKDLTAGFKGWTKDTLDRINNISKFQGEFLEVLTDYKEGKATSLSAKGRHDPCVLPRAVPMVEAMVALVLADHLLMHNAQCKLW